jgi:hypothetical protein
VLANGRPVPGGQDEKEEAAAHGEREHPMDPRGVLAEVGKVRRAQGCPYAGVEDSNDLAGAGKSVPAKPRSFDIR